MLYNSIPGAPAAVAAVERAKSPNPFASSTIVSPPTDGTAKAVAAPAKEKPPIAAKPVLGVDALETNFESDMALIEARLLTLTAPGDPEQVPSPTGTPRASPAGSPRMSPTPDNDNNDALRAPDDDAAAAAHASVPPPPARRPSMYEDEKV